MIEDSSYSSLPPVQEDETQEEPFNGRPNTSPALPSYQRIEEALLDTIRGTITKGGRLQAESLLHAEVRDEC